MSEHWHDAIPLEDEVTGGAEPGGADPRPRLPEPLPVRLVAVENVRLRAPRGAEEKLALFYVGLLQFERVVDGEPAAAAAAAAHAGEITFRADNFLLRFELVDPPLVHDTMRPQGIEVPDLAELEKKLVDAELEYTRQRGITPGRETLVLLDPAGNWVEISEIRLVT